MMSKLKNRIVSFFKGLAAKINHVFSVIGNSKFMLSVNDGFSKFGSSLGKLTRYNKLSYRKQKVVWSLIFLSPVIIGYCVFFLYPFFNSLIYSFSNVTVGFGRTDITNVGWANYNFALRVDADFIKLLSEAIVSTIVYIPILVIFSLLVAVMINGEFRGRTFVRAVFFVPVILNSDAINIVMGNAENLGNTVNQLGQNALSQIFDLKMFLTQANIPSFLVDFLSSITSQIYSIITYSGIQILIFLAAIQSVPGHLYEAAKIEGATKYESFWKITLPMVSPMIPTIIIYSIIDAFLRSPMIPILDKYYNAVEYGKQAAMSWVYTLASIFIIILYGLVLKRVVLKHDE